MIFPFWPALTCSSAVLHFISGLIFSCQFYFWTESYVKLQSCLCFGCLFLLACFLTFLPVNWELRNKEVCSRRWVFFLKCKFVNPEMGAALGFPFQVSQRSLQLWVSHQGNQLREPTLISDRFSSTNLLSSWLLHHSVSLLLLEKKNLN